MDILILAVLSGFGQLAAHYIPWQLILHRKLQRTEAYVIGVILMMAPFSVWLGTLGLWRVLLALWVVILTSGAMVIGAYALDRYLVTTERAQAAMEENHMLRETVFGDPNDQRR